MSGNEAWAHDFPAENLTVLIGAPGSGKRSWMSRQDDDCAFMRRYDCADTGADVIKRMIGIEISDRVNLWRHCHARDVMMYLVQIAPKETAEKFLRWVVEGSRDNTVGRCLSASQARMMWLCDALMLCKWRGDTALHLPETELHPAYMPILAAWIKAAARTQRMFVVTNSPDLLDRFTDCPECVRVMERMTADRSGPHEPRQLNLCHALRERIRDGWTLGDLWRIGDPLIGGWPW